MASKKKASRLSDIGTESRLDRPASVSWKPRHRAWVRREVNTKVHMERSRAPLHSTWEEVAGHKRDLNAVRNAWYLVHAASNQQHTLFVQ